MKIQMSLIDVKDIGLDVAGDVLTLTLGESSRKVKLPRGERGAPGRDGISIKGDQGEKGEQGRDGLPGRDSAVPGPKGDKGDAGKTGELPIITIGQVVTGEQASVILGGTKEEPVLNFVLPRGDRGFAGQPGKAGKDGSQEYVQLQYLGHSPRYTNDFISAHILADGQIELPKMREEDVGSWTWIKTFTDVSVSGLVEEVVRIQKGSRKFVVIAYNGEFKFTAF
jgi:hypothetical protein